MSSQANSLKSQCPGSKQCRSRGTKKTNKLRGPFHPCKWYVHRASMSLSFSPLLHVCLSLSLGLSLSFSYSPLTLSLSLSLSLYVPVPLSLIGNPTQFLDLQRSLYPEYTNHPLSLGIVLNNCRFPSQLDIERDIAYRKYSRDVSLPVC